MMNYNTEDYRETDAFKEFAEYIHRSQPLRFIVVGNEKYAIAENEIS